MVKTVLRSLVYVTIAVLVSCVLLEGLCRLLPRPQYAATWVWDPVLGHRGPAATIVPDGHILAAFDARGFRGDLVFPGYPGVSASRIVVLGDSFTEAASLPWQYGYAKVLERSIMRRSQRDVEVVSLAASDYGTANELLAYERFGSSYRPDLVLLQFFGLNDFINNGIAFADRNAGRSDFVRPYAVPEGGRKLPVYHSTGSVDFTYLYPRRRFLRERSRLFQFVEAAYVGLRWRRLNQRPAAPACPLEAEVFLEDLDERWQSALAVTQRMLRELRRLVDAGPRPDGTRPRLLAFYVPSVFEVDDASWQRAIAPVGVQCHPGRRFGPGQAEAKFQRVLAAAGIETVSLRDPIAEGLRAGRALYLPDGHFTVEGHRLVGDFLADALARRP